MKLNLGCGTRKMSGFVNVDSRRDLHNHDPRCVCDPDIVDDITVLKDFEANSVSLIYICHVLEHIKREERFVALHRWYELLKSGGILRISVPDFEAMAYAYVNKTVPFEKMWHMLNGSARHPYDFHYHSYDFEHLKKDLESTGFKDVYRYDWRKTDHAHEDDYSSAYYPHLQKDFGILLSLNVEAVK